LICVGYYQQFKQRYGRWGKEFRFINSDQNGHCIQQIESEVDVGESTPTHTKIQLEAAIYSAHGLLKVGLIEQATDLLTAFLPKEVNG